MGNRRSSSKLAAHVERFVLAHTRLKSPALLPEIRLQVGADPTPLWHATKAFVSRHGLPRARTMDPPYWAYAWAGGQGLARYVLDEPELVRGKAVLDVASGGAVEGIAAAMVGARRVVCADLDPVAEYVARMNAATNGVDIEAITGDATTLDASEFDLIFAGDVFYEASMIAGLFPWLRARARQGMRVLAADPGRTYAPREHTEQVARYLVKTDLILEGRTVRETRVYRVIG